MWPWGRMVCLPVPSSSTFAHVYCNQGQWRWLRWQSQHHGLWTTRIFSRLSHINPCLKTNFTILAQIGDPCSRLHQADQGGRAVRQRRRQRSIRRRHRGSAKSRQDFVVVDAGVAEAAARRHAFSRRPIQCRRRH